jgi:hypothetical protein
MKMARLLVQIPIGIDPNLLEHILKDIEGDSRNEKLRLCIAEGYKVLKR